jgi:hypothetical protein
MRKVIVSEFMTLDGVMQAPGGKDEDRDGGFEYGGWTVPYWHDDIGGSDRRTGRPYRSGFHHRVMSVVTEDERSDISDGSRVDAGGLSRTTIVSAIRSCTVRRFGCTKYWKKPNPSSSAEAPYPSARSKDCHRVKRSCTSDTTRIFNSRLPGVLPFQK